MTKKKISEIISLSDKAIIIDDDTVLINDDCVETMKGMDDNIIDLIITSPPYDNIRNYDGYIFDIKKVVNELYRVVKEGGVVVWIVGDATVNSSETGTSFRHALEFMDCGFNLHDTMIYYKDNPPPTGGNNRYYQSFEYMFVFSKGKVKTFNPLTAPRRNKHNDKRTVRTRPVTRSKDGGFDSKVVKVNTGDVKLQNVWGYVVSGGSVSRDMIAHQHPAIFPEALVRDHIYSWSNQNDLIFDPFSGSGTVMVVARDMGRRSIGSEVSPNYIEISTKRLGIPNE